MDIDTQDYDKYKPFHSSIKEKALFESINRLTYDIFYDLYKYQKGNSNVQDFETFLRKNHLPEKYEKYKDYIKKETYSSKPNFDFTFHVISLLKLKGENCKASKALFECLDNIKKIRNKLSHDYMAKEKNSQDFVDKLSELVTLLCKNMSVILNNVYWITKGKTINEELSTEYHLIIKQQEVQKDFQTLISNSSKELKKVYETLTAFPSFTFMDSQFSFPIDDVFVPIPLQVKKEKIHYQDILKHKNKNQKTEPSVVIISGDAGHGKSTICKKLTKEWVEGEEHMSKYDLVLLIEVKRAKEEGLFKYLKEILLIDTLHCKKEEDVIQFLEKSNILIIIDAYDEKSDEAEILIKSTLKELKNQRFIITTRPSHKDEIFSLLKQHKLEILDADLLIFECEDEKKFVDKVWNILKKEIPDRCGESKKYLEYLGNLPYDFRSIVRIPLMNMLLINLWINNEGKPLAKITLTNLYSKIFEFQKRVVINKIVQENKNMDDNLLSKNVERMIAILARHLYDNHLNNKSHLNYFNSETMLKNIGKSQKRHYETFLSTLFIYKPNVHNRNHFEFLHRTQMEYLIALHVTSLLLDKNISMKFVDIEIFTDVKQNQEIFSYTLGLLNAKNELKMYMDQVSDILKSCYDDYNFFWAIINETKSEKDDQLITNKDLCQRLKNVLNNGPEIWNLNEKNVVSAVCLLQYVDYQPNECIINFQNKRPEDIPMFEITFYQLGKKKLESKQKYTILQLHFEQHLFKGEKNSDKFMTCLKSWAKLRSFYGCLDKPSILVEFGNLKKVKLRIQSPQILEELKQISFQKQKFKNLKDITLYFDYPQSMKEFSSLQFHENTNISINVNKVQNIDILIAMLVKLKPIYAFFRISLDFSIDLSLEGAKSLCIKIADKKLLPKSLEITSPNDIHEKELDELKSFLIRKKKNPDKLIWNNE